MKSTVEHFKKSLDELLVTNEQGYTKEENLLFDSGLEVIFFDSDLEMKNEEKQLNEYVQSKGFEVKEKLLTINERIAVILN